MNQETETKKEKEQFRSKGKEAIADSPNKKIQKQLVTERSTGQKRSAKPNTCCDSILI